MGCRQAEDHPDSTVKVPSTLNSHLPRTCPIVRVDPFLDVLDVSHTRNFSEFDRVLSVKFTEIHTETSDFGQVLEVHGLDLTRVYSTNSVTWTEIS